jgi:ABC-2 type transport system permease protein
MRQRLHIEWLKLKNYRTFWILSGLYLLSIVGINYIVFTIQQKIFADKQAKGMAQMLIGDIPYSFPTVWQMTAYVSSFLLFIPGLLMIISITNEYSYKTHRQNIIDGWNRRQFITVKMVFAFLLGVVSTLMVIITATLFGFIEGSNAFSLERFFYIGYFLIQAISYIMVALLIGVLVKRGGLAIGIYFLYALVLENVLKLLLNYLFGTAGRYLPLQSTDELIPVPVFENVQRQFSTPPNFTVMLILSLVYLAAYFYLTSKRFETADL